MKEGKRKICCVCNEPDIYDFNKYVDNPFRGNQIGYYCIECYDQAPRKKRKYIAGELLRAVETTTNVHYIYELLEKIKRERVKRKVAIENIVFKEYGLGIGVINIGEKIRKEEEMRASMILNRKNIDVDFKYVPRLPITYGIKI